MGNGAKITLVALLIIMVVVVAKFVQNGSKEPARTGAVLTGGKPAGKPAAPGSSGADPSLRIPQKTIGQKKPEGAAAPPNVITNRPLTAGSPPVLGAESSELGSRILPPAGGAGGPGVGSARPEANPPSGSGTGSPPTAAGGPAPGREGDVVRIGATPPGGTPKQGEGTGITFTPVPEPGTESSGTGEGAGRTYMNPGSNAGSNPGSDSPGLTKQVPPLSERPPSGESAGTQASPFESPINRPLTDVPPNPITERPQPAAGDFPRKHQAVVGESYWELAEKYYGKGKGTLCKVIQEANGGRTLIAGETVTIPAPPVAVQPPPGTPGSGGGRIGGSPVGAPPRPASEPPAADSTDERYIYHTVRDNETLSGIAFRTYGNAGAIDRIYEANPNLKYVTMRVGQKIRLPKP